MKTSIFLILFTCICFMNSYAQEVGYETGTMDSLEVAQFITYNNEVGGLFSNSTAVTDNWIGKSVKHIRCGSINIIINKDNCRAELYINTGNQQENKAIFDKLATKKDEIDERLPNLEWQRMNDKVTCRIRTDRSYSYLIEEDKYKIFEFFVNKSKEMMDLFNEYGKKIKTFKQIENKI